MAVREFDWNTAHPWLRAAYEFGKQNQGWFAVKAGTEQHRTWQAYFDRIGWTPKMFLTIGDNDRQWTAPCEWPEWLPEGIETPQIPQSRVRMIAP